MNQQNGQNINISGSGSFSAGIYQDIRVSGSCRWKGEVSCEKLHVSGSCRGSGNIHAEEIHVSGSIKTDGEISAQGDVAVSGSVKTDRNLHAGGEFSASGGAQCLDLSAERIKISGSIRCRNVTASDLKISGGFSISGNVEAENVTLTAGGRIDGLLNAENIEIRAIDRTEPSRIASIGGGHVKISRDPYSLNLLRMAMSFIQPTDHVPFLETDLIEADEVDAVYTRARTIRADHVRIREGCEIDRVEYKNTFEADPSAKIGEVICVNNE